MADIRRLTAQDAVDFRALWLDGLQRYPFNFLTAYEDETLKSIDDFAAYLKKHCVLGYWNNETLGGMVGVGRVTGHKLCHKAHIWGMYVAPEWQGKGAAKALMEAAIAQAATEAEQVLLGYAAGNTAAEKLYQSLGFEQYGVEPRALKCDGRYADNIHMIKFLR